MFSGGRVVVVASVAIASRVDVIVVVGVRGLLWFRGLLRFRLLLFGLLRLRLLRLGLLPFGLLRFLCLRLGLLLRLLIVLVGRLAGHGTIQFVVFATAFQSSGVARMDAGAFHFREYGSGSTAEFVRCKFVAFLYAPVEGTTIVRVRYKSFLRALESGIGALHNRYYPSVIPLGMPTSVDGAATLLPPMKRCCWGPASMH